jgi:hypothetical protein
MAVGRARRNNQTVRYVTNGICSASGLPPTDLAGSRNRSLGDREERTMEPIVLFGIQFTLSLVAYSLIMGGTILAPGAVGQGVPMEFRTSGCALSSGCSTR